MDIWPLSEKAAYIADRHKTPLEQWYLYCNAKVGVQPPSDCPPDESLRFFLFDHFIIQSSLAEGFNSHNIEYAIDLREDIDKFLIKKDNMDDVGLIDNGISNRDRKTERDHYLELNRPGYDSLYLAVQQNTPLPMTLLQQSGVA